LFLTSTQSHLCHYKLLENPTFFSWYSWRTNGLKRSTCFFHRTLHPSRHPQIPLPWEVGLEGPENSKKTAEVCQRWVTPTLGRRGVSDPHHMAHLLNPFWDGHFFEGRKTPTHCTHTHASTLRFHPPPATSQIVFKNFLDITHAHTAHTHSHKNTVHTPSHKKTRVYLGLSRFCEWQSEFVKRIVALI
jgi:hypothetical protein